MNYTEYGQLIFGKLCEQRTNYSLINGCPLTHLSEGAYRFIDIKEKQTWIENCNGFVQYVKIPQHAQTFARVATMRPLATSTAATLIVWLCLFDDVDAGLPLMVSMFTHRQLSLAWLASDVN